MSKYVHSKQYLLQQSYLNNELKIRRKKLLQLQKNKFIFPNDFRRDHISNQLHEMYGCKTNEELILLNIEVNVSGRVIAKRIIGKAAFIVLLDSEGTIQLYITINSLILQKLYEENVKQLDLGDIIGAQGTLFKTYTAELSIHCKKIRLLTKALRPLPNKFHGLNNTEIKYRQRYLDLITNQESRETFKMRSLIVFEIRKLMNGYKFIEVETPMMHAIPGGAIARPFITYHNKFKKNMYLRIAPELYLKKLIVGGFERIFEINRNFRNESISSHHNPEFTMMEIYIAYVDYHDMIVFIQNLLQTLTKRVLGTDIIKYGEYKLNFVDPFIKMNMQEAIEHYLPEITSKNIRNVSMITDLIKSHGIEIDDNWSLERLHMILFEEVISKKIIQPTCITNFPIETSPLARCNDKDPKFADRFELYIAGHEIGNGFSELNNPDDQQKRFLQQMQNKKNNDQADISIDYDKDYVEALEYGLPPTAGIGIGIDRLVMLLTNKHNIRDVILFPTLRPK